MANPSLPPYGGYPFPPQPVPPHAFQQMLQAQHNQQEPHVHPPQYPASTPLNPQQPPPPPPQLYTPPYPNSVNQTALNSQSYSQNMQQQLPFPPWPAPPTPQQGPYNVPFPPYHPPNGFAVPHPPLPPPGFFPPPQAPHSNPSPASAGVLPTAPTAPTTIPAASPGPAPQRDTIANNRLTEMADSDKEEGEVSDGDGAPSSSKANQRNAPRSVPSEAPGMRGGDNASGRPVDPQRALDQRLQKRTMQATHAPSSRHANQSPNVAGDLETKRREAQVFLRLLNENNIGFSCLATEDLDTNLLRALYQTLGINVPPLSTASPSDRGARQVSNKESPVTIPSTTSTPNSQAHGLPKKPMPPVKTNIAQDSSSKSAPSPVDRKEYIARLQAAKMSKQSGATKDAAAKQSPLQEQAVVPSVATPPIASITGTPTMGTSTMPTTRPAVTKSDAEKVRQTELIKQRLELLKAQGKIPSAGPSTPQPSDSVDPVPKPRQTVLASGSNVDSQPRIPGLFMNSSPAPAISSAPTDAAIDRSQDEPRPSARRRPVAADLNDDITQPQSGPTYTRPLGQSPHEHHGESLIIDVSEDESGGSEMDLDDVQNEPHISSSSAPAMQNGSHIPRKPPLATELSSRSTSVNPTRSALNTPPVPRTPAGSNAEELINKHEKAILDLKMKIAKMTEKKKAAEASKGFISSSPVPRQSGSTENRRKRRAELEAALRSLDQGLENENGRLAQLEKEITEIRTKREQYQRDRENLMKELEEYGIETEGMNDEELQAQKDEIVQNNNHPDGEQFGNNVSGQAPTADFRDASRTRTLSQQPQITSTSVQVAPTGIDAFAASSQERAVERPTPSASSTTVAPTSIPRNRNSSVLTTFGRTKDELVYLRKNNLCFNCGKEGCTAKTCKHELPVPSKDIPAFQLAGAASADVVMTDAPEMSYPATSQIGTQEQQGIHAVPPETVAAENGVESSTSVDEEDFYSPSPETAGSTAAVIQPLPGAVEEAEVVSPSEEGEVAMSESSTDDEEEYVPDEPYTAPAGAVAPPAAPTTVREEVVKVGVASNNPPSASTTEDEDEGELYEPPEPNQIQTNIQMQETSPLETRSHSMDIDDTGEMEISTLSPSSSDSEAALEQSHDRQFRGSISSNQPVQSGMAVADDLAPELQSQRPTIDGPVAEPAAGAHEGNPPTTFEPYKSPLRMFKSYRYHPSFLQEVAGGFLSLTYSHQIDPEKPLCRFETVGGTCNDPHCEGQHFQDMNISGDKLLVQLGTANPGKTPVERQKWNDGLKLVLKELRQEKIKNDPDRVAMEIAKYRRRFFDDDTRVVNL